MDGMLCEEYYLWDYYYSGDKHVSASWQFELAPTPTIAQITLGDFAESDHASVAQAMLGFESCTYLDPSGVTRTDALPGTSGQSANRILARNRLASVTFGMRSVNCSASVVLNLFFWPSVF